MADNEMKEFNQEEIIKEPFDIQKYINKLVENLRNDKSVYEHLKQYHLTLKQVKDNIGLLAEFQEDFHTCENCPGFEKCPKENKHLSVYVYKDGNYLTTKTDPCKKLLEELKRNAQYVFSDFPNEWKKSTLKQLDLSENRRPVIKAFCDIAKGNSQRWLYVKGNSKIGKSYLLTTFANEFIALGLGKVGIINATNKFKELSDISFSEKEYFKKQLDLLMNVPLLVIDDFGEEYKNEFIRDSIVLPILNERNRNNLLTFFSSKFTINEIQKLYSIGKNSGDIMGKQLGNLLRDNCQTEFDLTGASIYRK